MIKHILRHYGIRIQAPKLEPQESEDKPPALPPDHPCRGCGILTWHVGKPYCFLPRCNRDIFKPEGSDAVT